MAKKKNSKEGGDVFENPEVLAESLGRTERFIQTNKKLVMIGGGIAAAIIAVLVFGKIYIDNSNQDAQREMFQAVYYFEADSLSKALNGDDNNYGFLDIINEYGMSETGNLAKFYAGASYLKMKEYNKAIAQLESFSASDLLVQARAYALIGDANMELGKYEDAASYYEKAANYNANKDFSPIYLVKAAIANEKAADLPAALSNYQKILDDFFGATEYQEATKHKARIEGLLN